MNCYESLKITALLTVIFGVMCLPPCSGAATPQTRHSADYRRAAVHNNGDISRLTAAAADWYGGYEDIQCETVALAAAGGSSRYFLRNRCGAGLLSVDDRKKVVVQETGLTPGHPAAAIIKEVCRRRSEAVGESADAWKRRRRIEQSSDEIFTVAGRQFVRYRHHASKRYVCFDRRGRVRAVIARKVEKRGLLCLFEEEQIDSSFHTIKSAFNPTWHLAFSNRRAFRQKYNGDKVLPSKRGFAANRGSCEAQFHSGHFEDVGSSHSSEAAVSSGHKFLGIFKQISKEIAENNTISSYEQAHNYIHDDPPSTMNSQNKNSDKTVSEQFISSSRRSSSISTTSRIYNKNQQHTVNLAVDNSINDDISENKDDMSATEKSADDDSNSKQLITPSAAFAAAYPHHAVVRLQNAWAFAAAATASEQSLQKSVVAADNEIDTNNSKPKIRHFAKKRPRPSRREKNRLKKKRRSRRGAAQVARKFKAMNSA